MPPDPPLLTRPMPPRPCTGRGTEGTALYVHLPFCAAKCHYCDFFSVPVEGPGERQDVDGMVAAILREAEERAPWHPRTVFLGGGTPSLLSREQLATLLDGLQRITGWRDSAHEVTAECNPESLDRDKARALLDLGVARLSIGLQSLHDEVLELFGRVHSAEDGLRAFEAARAAGVEHLNVDLIYAVPGQTEAGWREDLARVLALGPDHLSAYNLTFEEGTRFQRWLEQGKLSTLPEELELALFHATRELCAGAGLGAYEVSNYSLSGQHCHHNVNYWHNGEYVGLGPGAVSRVGPTRSGNPRAIAPYVRWIGAAGHATQWDETLDPAARLGETWWLGLRLTEGLDPARARATAGWTEPEDPARPVAERLVASGHLEHVPGASDAPVAGDPGTERYRLTPLGLPVADAVAAEFLGELGGRSAPGAEPA